MVPSPAATSMLVCSQQVVLKERSPRRRSLLVRGLQEARDALSNVSSAAVAAGSAHCDTVSSGVGSAPKEAAADAAMRELLVRVLLLFGVSSATWMISHS